MKLRTWLSGRNNLGVTRTVNAYDAGKLWDPFQSWEIGTVTPKETKDWGFTWDARDMEGNFHGTWLTDWYAADALLRVYVAKHGKAA